MKLIQVDAFTETPFRGNPAAVCLLDETRSDDWMQAVAMEMNLSETAFITPQEDGFGLRWFTPVTEVNLCGHATLASAHVLWQEGRLKTESQARFHTRSGLLSARLREGWIELDFPRFPIEPAEAPSGLLEALDVSPAFVGSSSEDLLLELVSEESVRSLKPNFTLLKTIGTRGIIVTSRSASSDFDFVSRFFAPAVGIDEDPATGSSHCVLGPFWAERLGKSELRAYQASARGGFLRVRVGANRVYLQGKAVTVLRGELV